jgi:predicted metal-dependent peptidase
MSRPALDLDKLAAAKLWLISESSGPTGAEGPRNQAYLAHALYALIPVAAPEVPRLSCDERWRVYVNPGWLTETAVQDVGRELAHVTWHLLLDHADRARDQHVDATNSGAWTQASDATIAHTLGPSRICPSDLPSAADLELPEGRSAEEYFALIARLEVNAGPDGPQEQPPLPPGSGCGSAADGVRREHELPPDADAGEVLPEDAREIRRRVAIEYDAHQRRHGRGDTPGDAWRWAKRILEPTVRWEPLLAGAVRRAAGWASGRTDYTYSRPSRRQSSAPRVLLPGMRRPVPQVAVVVDTSASVDDVLLGRALGEVDGALRGLGVSDSCVSVYSCDAAVHQVQRVRSARDARLAGGGGTDMRVGIKAAGDQRPRPDVIVVFTDGDTPWPESPPPGSAVIAALLGRERSHLPPTPPWATRVECLAG